MSIEKQTQKEINEMSPPTESKPAGSWVEPDTDPASGAKEKFDPNIHATDKKTGEPILRKDGYYRRKPGFAGAKKQTSEGQKSSTIGVDPGTGMAMATGEMQVVASAKTVVHLQEMGGILLWGQLGVMQKEEKDYLLYAWATYLAEVGVDNIPPGVVVLMASAMYAIPRFIADEKSRAKVAALWAKIFPKPETEKT